MKRMLLTGAILVFALGGAAGEVELPVHVSKLTLDGQIDGENIVFTLAMDAEVNRDDTILPLVVGDVAYLDGDFPRSTELVRDGNRYVLRYDRDRHERVSFTFASRAVKEGDWRRTSFEIPAASIRKLSVICDREDLEIRFPGALQVDAGQDQDGRKKVTAYLGTSRRFEVRWKPEVKRLEGDLVASCDANTIATAGVGALRLDTILTYRIIQGRLATMAIDLPDVNVTQVIGQDIQDWRIDRSDPDRPRLVIGLSRPREDTYRLKVESEMILPAFPCAFRLPVLVPRDVIRTSGFLLAGADSAIKLSAEKAGGLTQVDPAAFPTVQLEQSADRPRERPSRVTYAYQYANSPYTLDLAADDIVTSIAADARLVLSLRENELVWTAGIELDIKDAPARELEIEIDSDPAWTVTSVAGQHVSEADTDVRERDGRRTLFVPFKAAVSGPVLVDVRMERSQPAGETTLSAPHFRLLNTRSVRGYMVTASEKGVRLRTAVHTGLREVHTGSAPMRVAGAQQAFRFRDQQWRLDMRIERTTPSLHAEVFHLVSLGEGALYSSAAVTYHVSGAPIREFELRIPAAIETVELTGNDLESWQREGDVCTVRLQTRVIGDYTLLVTYDRQYAYEEGEDLSVGGVETIGTESEVGYIVLASSASLKISEAAPLPTSIIPIEREEIPAAYSAPVTDPIIGSYKYVNAPHTALIHVAPYPTEQLLGQIADYVKLDTAISRDGEAVTTATYFIKNASRQYLVVALPEGVEPWSIKTIEDDGTKRDVLSQEGANGILIPIPRPRDPNTALRVEIVYAQSLGAIGFWRGGVRGIRPLAPALPAAHGTFASWRLSVPDGWVVAGADGNMTPRQRLRRRGLSGLFETAVRLVRAMLDGPGGRTVTAAAAPAGGAAGTVEFTRAVNLAAEGPLDLRLFVVPGWVGSGGSARVALAGTALGCAVLLAGFLFVRRPIVIAIGATALALGLSRTAAGGLVLGAAAAMLALGVAGWLFVRYGVRFAAWFVRRLWRAAAWRAARGWAAAARCIRLAAAGAVAAGLFVGRSVRGGWRRWRAARERAYLRRVELRMAARSQPQPPPAPPASDRAAAAGPAAPDRDEPPASGLLPTTALMLAVLLALAGTAHAAPAPVRQAAPPPLMQEVVLDVIGPGTGRDAERSAQVRMDLEFEMEQAGSFVVVPADSVLIDFELDSRNLEIVPAAGGYRLLVDRRGDYRVRVTFRTPVADDEGTWRLALPLPPNMRNTIKMQLPEPGLDVECAAAVLFRRWETDTTSHAEAVIGPADEVLLSWQPRVRKTRFEETVFFCEINSYARLRAGVVDLTSLLRYQVAQGEKREFRVEIPDDMTVTAVQAPGLATWSFDPATRFLDAILDRPVSGDFAMAVVTQISSEGLPYDAVIRVPRVANAARQRGALAVAAAGSIQVAVESVTGLSPMNQGDFPAEAVLAAYTGGACSVESATVRRAFRYHEPEAAVAAVHAERVLPEVRVVENGTVSVADERIVLATKLTLNVAKAGIFSTRLGVPGDYEVETLTGPDVAHWDEDEPARGATNAPAEGGREVTIHFTRQVTDATELNVVVARMERGIEQRIAVPRVHVADARKHGGRLTVSGERGVRLMVETQRGVDIKKASEEGIEQSGVLVFDILRPSWAMTLTTEVMDPLLKPEVLQWVDLAEGMLQCRAYIQCRIENAGVKQFRLQAPAPGMTVSVTGRNIARVHEVDAGQGIWQVDLHGKVEKHFGMTATYQVPFDPAHRAVSVRPLKVLDADAQRGYLVVTCAGRVQVQPTGGQRGLKIEDPRNIPAAFGAGDLSGAILCYRSLRGAYALDLSVVRHESAQVLPATIDQARFTSVVSSSGKLLTQMVLDMTVGDLRFLRLELPHDEDTLWTALVNGREVALSRDGRWYCIPLEARDGAETTTVEMIYAGRGRHAWLGARQTYAAPTFELPLSDIQWDFYVLPGYTYGGFDGTMTPVEESFDRGGRVFDTAQYRLWNEARREESLRKARTVLETGEKLARSGQQQEAKQAFQQALNYSIGQADLNEDARVQYRNLVKQQVKLGLVDRRNAMRYNRNIYEEDQAAQPAQRFQGGNFSPEYAREIEQSLDSADNDALDVVADRIIEQQAAAAGVIKAIHITMPEHGVHLAFRRPLQIDPGAELTVSFRTVSGTVSALVRSLASGAVTFVVLWLVAGRLMVRRRS